MNPPEIILTLVRDEGCPLYREKDEFFLVGRVLYIPGGKPTCTTLVADILRTYLGIQKGEGGSAGERAFGCSGAKTGCVGAVRMEWEGTEETVPEASGGENKGEITELLKGFSIFQDLETQHLAYLANFLKLKKFPKDGVVLKKGDPGDRLYIVVSGGVEVVEDSGVRIARLGKGEVFGEMSLLSGDPVAAGVRAAEITWVLYVKGTHFRRMLTRFPSLKEFFARLLSRRLTRANQELENDAASAMTGRLSEIAPAELLQTLHQNQKTGVLTLDAEGEVAILALREGEPVRAILGDLEGAEAFYAVLKARSGRFKFTPGLDAEDMEMDPMGDFMWLLMEGLNRIDEERAGGG
jgi:CRP-like cAMP-binding protein